PAPRRCAGAPAPSRVPPGPPPNRHKRPIPPHPHRWSFTSTPTRSSMGHRYLPFLTLPGGGLLTRPARAYWPPATPPAAGAPPRPPACPPAPRQTATTATFPHHHTYVLPLAPQPRAACGSDPSLS